LIFNSEKDSAAGTQMHGGDEHAYYKRSETGCIKLHWRVFLSSDYYSRLESLPMNPMPGFSRHLFASEERRFVPYFHKSVSIHL
jgi:hypothetical protein